MMGAIDIPWYLLPWAEIVLGFVVYRELKRRLLAIGVTMRTVQRFTHSVSLRRRFTA